MCPIITKLQPTKRDPTRVMIRLDGKVIATLPRKMIDDLGIAVDLPWSQALANQVALAVDADKAKRYAMNALGRRALSSGELADRIRRRGHSETVAAHVVEQLLDVGVLDDLQYARAVIRRERARKATGANLLRSKLFQKRVPRPIIDKAINEAEADGEYDHLEAARSLVARRLRTTAMRKADPATRQRRLWSLLVRRGFNTDTIRQALSNIADPSDQEP